MNDNEPHPHKPQGIRRWRSEGGDVVRGLIHSIPIFRDFAKRTAPWVNSLPFPCTMGLL